MDSKAKIRAATSRARVVPSEQFLTRGFAKLVAARSGSPRRAAFDPGVVLPKDLARFVAVATKEIGDFVPRAARISWRSLLSSARKDRVSFARLVALLAGAIPFGSTRTGELFTYFVGDAQSPARDVVAIVDEAVLSAPRLVCKGAPAFAALCALNARGEDASAIPTPGVAEQEAVRAAFERARVLMDLLVAGDAKARRGAQLLAKKPLDRPLPPDRKRRDRGPLVLGAVVEAFFRADLEEARAIATAHVASPDTIVRDAAKAVLAGLAEKGDLARRRALSLRAGEKKKRATDPNAASARTRKLVATVDAAAAGTIEREEALLALADLGDRSVVPSLVARALTGDVAAVDMLGVVGDRSVVPHLLELLHRGGSSRDLDSAVVRALAAQGSAKAAPLLRETLEHNPMPSWREGIAKGTLVRELVAALGALRDEAAGPLLVEVLEATSQEYRAVLPIAAWALGRARHLPALAVLERMLSSPKDTVTCEVVWAIGEIGAAHREACDRASSMLSALTGLEPGAECVRLTALAKMNGAPRASELRRAIDRALWEPAFRSEETSRRRVWALRSLSELASRRADRASFFLGHEAVRYFATRDDNAVRRAAEEAFAAWKIDVPEVRRYYAVVVEQVEKDGGLDALHEAVRDPLGVFRRNVAWRIAEIGSARSARPLAEATARVFAEPPTSTYEYDDAPAELVVFVRALAKLNLREGNDVLIDGLRSGNHHVKAVVAEHAPDDRRFVPELMAMLGDPRSFLRSRAERSLVARGVLPDVHARSGETRIVEV